MVLWITLISSTTGTRGAPKAIPTCRRRLSGFGCFGARGDTLLQAFVFRGRLKVYAVGLAPHRLPLHNS